MYSYWMLSRKADTHYIGKSKQEKNEHQTCHTPAERKLVFWSDLWPKPPWELGLGQGPSEKCIWKIFYRAILEILKAEGPLKTKYAISLVFIG